MNFPKHERGPYRGRYLDPSGQLMGNFQQLMDVGCIQAENRELEQLYCALMIVTKKNPCAGCPVWNNKGPECKAFQLYHTACTQTVAVHQQVKSTTTPNNVPADHPLAGLSIKKITEKLGVSIGEVRRRKASGTL